VRELRSKIAVASKLETARSVKDGSMEAETSSIEKESKERIRKAVAREYQVPEKKMETFWVIAIVIEQKTKPVIFVWYDAICPSCPSVLLGLKTLQNLLSCSP
jgi:hypothetical protein